MNDHFKVGHYKSLEREKEDEKNVEESEETDEEKEHTDENEDDITQLAQGPMKESGTSDEKDETRRRLCDLGTWLGRVNELTDREKYMALTDPFVPPRHFKFPVRTEYGKERRCQESYLNEFDGVVYSQSLDTLLCKYCILFDNGSSSQSCFINSSCPGAQNVKSLCYSQSKNISHRNPLNFVTSIVCAENREGKF